eukprot:CAMPEP_0175146666 /NCGR_PEP_ID=MMETSP0087-20121206/15507_1 /TAXON_ID=136419 /ORGANISM="Unknown Unknown, Strain D1" /LENGTH=220 /DNA_ID=CAMNT_0016431657 /DNA_START=221 /DNA_END=881 /DNA_ORIENTATION=-
MHAQQLITCPKLIVKPISITSVAEEVLPPVDQAVAEHQDIGQQKSRCETAKDGAFVVLVHSSDQGNVPEGDRAEHCPLRMVVFLGFDARDPLGDAADGHESKADEARPTGPSMPAGVHGPEMRFLVEIFERVDDVKPTAAGKKGCNLHVAVQGELPKRFHHVDCILRQENDANDKQQRMEFKEKFVNLLPEECDREETEQVRHCKSNHRQSITHFLYESR